MSDLLLPGAMFVTLIILLMSGFPVAFVIGGVGLGFAGLGIVAGEMSERRLFLMAPRIWASIGDNLILVAVPMFIFMGTMLERSGVARDLLALLGHLLRRVRGGLSFAVVLMGTVLATTTGIVGASVVMTALLALPMMLRGGYAPALAAGTVAASGTLGILIPPSIMLVIMADMLSIPVSDLFLGAIGPGLALAACYVAFLAVAFGMRPDLASTASDAFDGGGTSLGQLVLRGLVPPVVLFALALGSIFAGLGALGALGLAAASGRLTRASLAAALDETVLTVAMIFMIFVGATIFAFVFRTLGGEHAIVALIEGSDLSPWGFLFGLLGLIFLLGFVLDWVEIALIVFPIFAPVIAGLDFGAAVPPGQVMTWFAVLVAVNLQTSYLTPPFGFALFYLRGVAPPELPIGAIYRGVIPFVALQLAVMGLGLLFPALILWLPGLQ